MDLNLTPVCLYGNIQYHDQKNKITAARIGKLWYPTIDTELFDAGFTSIGCMEGFLQNLDQYEEGLSMLGYGRQGSSFINNSDPRFWSEIKILDDGIFRSECRVDDQGYMKTYKYRSDNFDDLTSNILNLLDTYQIDLFASITITSNEDAKYVIEAKMSSRDLAKNLVRVKSSNIWSYGINIKNRKDKKGDVVVQFKDPKGGAGDLYIYYDVDIVTWRKLLASPSKGHGFWVLIRNRFKYSKLTGDKKGKLKNAIN